MMNKVKILVAEDDFTHAAKIEMLLDEMGYDLVGIFPTEEEVLRLFRATAPDLLILDIQLSQGGDGVFLASKINSIRPIPIIFATSFDDKETINRALKTDPYAYIVKPVEKPSLQAAIELAIFKFNKSQQDVSPNLSDEANWTKDLVLKDSFFIKAGSKLMKVPLSGILWIEVGEERYCDIVTVDRKFPVRTSMNYLEQTLAPSVFVRIHRSYIVNMEKIEGIDEVEMTLDISGQTVPLGAAYKTNLLQRLQRL